VPVNGVQEIDNRESIVDMENKKKITDFVINNYLFGDAARMPMDDESLIESGIIDSTGIIELIQFLESEFRIKVQDSETLPQNLDRISNLVRFIAKKTAAS
jgi:acyl carrier protein